MSSPSIGSKVTSFDKFTSKPDLIVSKILQTPDLSENKTFKSSSPNFVTNSLGSSFGRRLIEMNPDPIEAKSVKITSSRGFEIIPINLWSKRFVGMFND